MSDDGKVSGGIGILGWTAIWGIIGYLVYGSVELAIAVAGMELLLSLVLVISIIPILGMPFYYILATDRIVPFVYEVTSLYPTWVTEWIFGLNMVIAVIIWVYLIMIIIIKLSN